jgi:hypothetical protein
VLQGALSPLLFNLVVDILSMMLQKATSLDLNKGLGNELVEGGVINLQYVDDTILFVEKNVKKAKNLKWILTYFELMSGMRVIFHKIELVPINYENVEEIHEFADIFGCPVGAFQLSSWVSHYIIASLEGKTYNL